MKRILATFAAICALSLSAAPTRSMVAGRHIYGSASALPYDAEVEYVAVGAGQICYLGVEPTVNTVLKIDALFENTNGNLHFGFHTGATEYSNFRVFYYASTLYFDLGSYPSQGGRCEVSGLSLRTRYDMEFGNNYVIVDGAEVARKNTSSTVLTQSGFQFGPGASKIYSAQISTGGTLQRDLIPVRVGVVGYFYDKVSGAMFGAATGSLTPGPDKN